MKRNVARLPNNAFAKLTLPYHFYWISGRRDFTNNLLYASFGTTDGHKTWGAFSLPCCDLYKPQILTQAFRADTADSSGNMFLGAGSGDFVQSNARTDAAGGSITVRPRQANGWDRLMQYYRMYRPLSSKISLVFRQVGSTEVATMINNSASQGVDISSTVAATTQADMNNTPMRLLFWSSPFSHRMGETNWVAAPWTDTAGDGAVHDNIQARIPHTIPLDSLSWNRLRQERGVHERRLSPWEEQGRHTYVKMFRKIPRRQRKQPSAVQTSPAGGTVESSINPTTRPWNSKHEDSGAAGWLNQTKQQVSREGYGFFSFAIQRDDDLHHTLTAQASNFRTHPTIVRVDGTQTFFIRLMKPYNRFDDGVLAPPVLAVDADGDRRLDDDENVEQGNIGMPDQ